MKRRSPWRHPPEPDRNSHARHLVEGEKTPTDFLEVSTRLPNSRCRDVARPRLKCRGREDVQTTWTVVCPLRLSQTLSWPLRKHFVESGPQAPSPAFGRRFSKTVSENPSSTAERRPPVRRI